MFVVCCLLLRALFRLCARLRARLCSYGVCGGQGAGRGILARAARRRSNAQLAPGRKTSIAPSASAASTWRTAASTASRSSAASSSAARLLRPLRLCLCLCVFVCVGVCWCVFVLVGWRYWLVEGVGQAVRCVGLELCCVAGGWMRRALGAPRPSAARSLARQRPFSLCPPHPHTPSAPIKPLINKAAPAPLTAASTGSKTDRDPGRSGG